MSSGDALIQDFVAGRYRLVETGAPVVCPIRAIVTAPSLAGREAALVKAAGLAGRLAVVSDENTHDVMGRRVEAALPGAVSVVLDHPHADEATADLLRERTRHCDGLVAVGAGTLNDLCKYVSHADGRACAVFATAPSMNGYVTSTVSINRGDYKLSLKAHAPAGVFYDLEVLAASPRRMIRAGLGDAICRGVAQVDWLFSHLLLDTAYFESPYDLQLVDEPKLFAAAPRLLAGDLEAMTALVDMLTLGGLGVIVAGTSHSGSMGEHGISHFIDMFARPHPGSLHGEQVGIATLTMARLQGAMLADPTPPVLAPAPIDEAALAARYGDKAPLCIAALASKALDGDRLDAANGRLAEHWDDWRRVLGRLMVPPVRLEATLAAAGAATRPAAIGLDPDVYRLAVAHAHEIRDRFSFLDLAAATGQLEAFAATEG
jgi:glycerol-1-phosphate dehydrogenase [NAD(P)+]